MQRRALEVALLRAEETGALQQRAVAAAFRGVLGSLAREHPLVVAIDDVQWLDRASAQALAYAARRLTTEPVAFLLATRIERGGQARGLLEAFPTGRCDWS